MLRKIAARSFQQLPSLILLVFIFCTKAGAQNSVLNGGFSALNANWTFFAPANSVETEYPETTYGGPSPSNIVGEIDQLANLRQTNIMVNPGQTYYFSFKHARRIDPSVPNPVQINIKIYNGNAVFLNQDVSSTDTTWQWHCETYQFTPATSTVTLDIANTTPVLVSEGTIVDNITITPVSQTLTKTGNCPGDTYTLSVPADANGLVYTNCNWTGPNGFTATGNTITFINAQTSINGTYTCHMTINDCIPATGIFDLQVAAKPDVSLVDDQNKILCNNATFNLALANPAATNTYQWYKNNVVIPGATNTTLMVNAVGGYKVIATSPAGCTNTSSVVNIDLGHVSADFNFSIAKACSDDTVRFTNTSDAGQYLWNFGDQSAFDTATNPVHIYENQSSYTVKLKVTGTNGCSDSAVKIININHPIHAAFNVSADTVCQNAATPVSFTNTSIGNITTWNWDFGMGTNGSAATQNPSFQYPTAGTYTVRLIVGDVIPCYDTAYHSIKVDSMPFLSFGQDKHAICVGEDVRFTATYANTAPFLNWDFGDGTTWNQSDATNHGYDRAGLFFTTVKGDFGACGVLTFKDSVVVNAFPKVDLGPDSALCLDGPAIRVSNLNNTNPAGTKLLWSTGATTPDINIVHPGIYTLTATLNDCATTERITINKDCYTDIPNVFSPNNDGVNDYFYPRQLLSKGVTAFAMTIYNRWGEIIFKTNVADGRGWDGKFNGKNQPMGVYIYQMKVLLKNGRMEDYTGNVTLVR